MIQEYKDRNNKLENEFSTLSTEDIGFIREKEQQLNIFITYLFTEH